MNKRDRTPERQIMIDVQSVACVRVRVFLSAFLLLCVTVVYGCVSTLHVVWCALVWGCKHACFLLLCAYAAVVYECVFEVCLLVCLCVCRCSCFCACVHVSLWL